MGAARRWLSATFRFGLGLFVVGQLLFLLAANFVPMIENVRPHLKNYESVRNTAPEWVEGEGAFHETCERATTWTARWSEVTGQPQSWSLFAPEVGHSITFIAVELRWDDDDKPALADMPPQLLPSDNEPRDLRRFFRVGKFRLRRYEGGIDMLLTTPTDSRPEEMKDTWRGWIEDKVQRSWRRMLAYLRWRTREFLAEHPDSPPPRQVILHVYRYEVPDPGAEPWFWGDPHKSKVARWRPGATPAEGYLPVEAYNPLLDKFEPVRP